MLYLFVKVPIVAAVLEHIALLFLEVKECIVFKFVVHFEQRLVVGTFVELVDERIDDVDKVLVVVVHTFDTDAKRFVPLYLFQIFSSTFSGVSVQTQTAR